MRVLISGAGIAGLTVAYWLRRYGFTPTIVERAPSLLTGLLTGGYKVDVRGTALQVLRRMSIHDAVVAASTDMQGALLVDKHGKVIIEMTGDAFGHRVGGAQRVSPPLDHGRARRDRVRDRQSPVLRSGRSPRAYRSGSCASGGAASPTTATRGDRVGIRSDELAVSVHRPNAGLNCHRGIARRRN